jgi:hypothetical protein
MRRVLPLLGLLFAVGLLCAPTATARQTSTSTATPVLDRAADALRSDPVYVDADAERAIASDDAARVRNAIRSSGDPVFVAVLPSAAIEEAGGNADDVPRVLGQATGLAGTYAIVAGSSFRAGSNTLSAGTAGSIATAAFQAHRNEGTTAVLLAFVDGVANGAGGLGAPAGPGTTPEPSSGTDLTPVLLVGGAGALGLWAWSKRRRRRDERASAADYAADRQMIQAELSVIADDVMALEPEVQIHPNARADYDAAVTRYRAASAALEYADDAVDLVRVRRVLLEAQYAIARTKAAIDGREAPAPPSELQSPGAHDEPPIAVDDDTRRPVYVGAGPFYGGGWFGGGGSLIGGLLLGSLLGGGWGRGGWSGEWSGGGGGWGGGGGGDWGGGGGGDWGGGTGGGDW